jgi:hypothetical protein
MTRRRVWGELNRLDTAVYAAIARPAAGPGPGPGPQAALAGGGLLEAVARKRIRTSRLRRGAGPARRRQRHRITRSHPPSSNVVLKPLWGRRRPERVEHRVPFAPRVRMPKTRSFPSDTRIRFRLRDWRGERGAGTWRPAHRTRRTRRLLARAYGSALPLGHRSRRRHRRLALADRGGRRQALSSRGTLTRSARGRIENRSGGASSIASPSTPACTVDGASTSRERAFHARPGERRCRGGASMTMIPRRPPSSFGRAPRASGRSSA